VSVLLDTNVLVRHLTGDPRDQARRATAFLEAHHALWLVDLVVSELVYVLRSFYGLPRAQTSALVRAVLEFPAVSVTNRDVLYRSLSLFESGQLDFAEAYLVALAEEAGVDAIASFDRSLDRIGTVTRMEP
jgi:predicted nucleic acid-binding protein